MPFARKIRESEKERDLRELLQALTDTREELNRARIMFDHACEPELVDAVVYEINSLNARYDYLLRKVREEEGFGAVAERVQA